MEQKTKVIKDNPMKKIFIEKVIISCGGIKEELDKSVKLLEKISGKGASRRLTMKRIPGFSIRPKMEVGCMVTLRGNEGIELLKRLLAAIENNLSLSQISDNHFSFQQPWTIKCEDSLMNFPIIQ